MLFHICPSKRSIHHQHCVSNLSHPYTTSATIHSLADLLDNRRNVSCYRTPYACWTSSMQVSCQSNNSVRDVVYERNTTNHRKNYMVLVGILYKAVGKVSFDHSQFLHSPLNILPTRYNQFI